MRLHRFGALAAIALLPAAAAAAQSAAPAASAASVSTVRTRVQATLDSIRAGGAFPGMSAGLALPDGQVLSLATGLSDTALRTPLGPDALLLAGSVGKTYGAAVALQLVSEGKLSLDEPIST